MAADIEGAARAYLTGLEAIDACYPDADKAAALRIPEPGPDRDVVAALIRARWADAIATQSPGRPVSPPSLTDRAAVGA